MTGRANAGYHRGRFPTSRPSTFPRKAQPVTTPDPVPTFAEIVDRFTERNPRAAAVRDFNAHGVAFLAFLRDHVHPGHVFGDMVAFVPQGASAACDEPGDADHGDGIDDQYCPECGTGDNGDGTFRLPINFPAERPCATCERRSAARFARLGAEFAERQEQAVLGRLLGDDQGDGVEEAEEVEEGDGVTVEHTNNAGLVAELADALSTGDRAALVVSAEQLAIIIEALDNVPTCRTRLRTAVADLLPGLRKLFAAAFVPGSGD